MLDRESPIDRENNVFTTPFTRGLPISVDTDVLHVGSWIRDDPPLNLPALPVLLSLDDLHEHEGRPTDILDQQGTAEDSGYVTLLGMDIPRDVSPLYLDDVRPPAQRTVDEIYSHIMVESAVDRNGLNSEDLEDTEVIAIVRGAVEKLDIGLL
jgi:hypothetical protein